MPSLFDRSSLVALALGWGLFFALLTVVMVTLGFAWEPSAAGRRRRIFALPVPAGQRRREALAKLGFGILPGGEHGGRCRPGDRRCGCNGECWYLARGVDAIDAKTGIVSPVHCVHAAGLAR